MRARTEVADFWDDVLARWLAGHDHLVPPLPEWLASYQGKGDGAVDLAHYPDPYVGDLRGFNHEPRLVLLGLNPGIGYDSLQAPDGLWAERVRREGYSHCLQRSPAEDPDAWIDLHGKPSVYWHRLIRFARRWLDDPAAGVHDLLDFELYPWHSRKIQGPMKPPAHILQRFVWEPSQEVTTSVVFAFGRPWFALCDDLGLPVIERYGGPDGKPLKHWAGDWRVHFFELPSRQVAVVSSQLGYAGPPGDERTKELKELVATVTG